jgi:two-component system chemotaxis response regulator CheB
MGVTRKVRVLIIDGEVVSRRLICRAVEGNPLFELVGTSALGEPAMEKACRLRPELVLLAIGDSTAPSFETLGLLRSSSRDLPIIVINPHARRGTPLTLEALSLGASGYVAYEELTSDECLIERLGKDLAAEARRLSSSSHGGGIGETREKHSSATNSRSSSLTEPGAVTIAAPIEIVVIGVSTGGPNALAAIMPAFSPDFPVPVVIVQHMLDKFCQPLAARLDSLGPLMVREAFAGAEAKPGTAWLAPKGVHVEVRNDPFGIKLAFSNGPEENMCKPAADVLFRSAARVFGSRVLGVVLTGMGFDGVAGCREIRAAGGTVIVQDIPSCVIEGGMPGNVAQAGLAHKVLPLSEIGPEIVRIARLGRTSRGTAKNLKG